MNKTVSHAVTCGNHYHSAVESRPVFADPSGRRRQVLRFAGIGSMAVLAAFLVAVVVAMTGGPKAPFTQWAGPQAPSSAKHGGQALTGGSAKSGAPRTSGGSGGSSQAGTGPGGASTPTTRPASPSPSAGPSSAPSA